MPTKTVTAEHIFDEVFAKKIKNIDQDSKNKLSRCLMVRFFYRFCIPFGILKNDYGDRFLDKKPNDPFEKTDFFMSQFKKIISEPTDPVYKADIFCS